MKPANLDPSSSNDLSEQLSWLWPESTTSTPMAGLYTHPSFVATGPILTPPNNSSRGEKGDSGSSGGSTLTPTISNSSHISMSNSSGGYGNGSTPNFIATEPHPGTLVTTLESPLGSPTGARKTSIFSTTAVNNSKSSPFRFVNGRRFHSDETCVYILPCDIPELTRQGLKHHLFREVFGGYHMADFSDFRKIPSKVLDIGCGTGIWIASMHDEFAARGRDDVKFVGMDVVPVYAPLTDVDFTFVRHNCLNFPFPFQDGEFDYVFIRDLTLAIPDTFVQSDVLAECLRVLGEGGVLEVQCTDLVIRSLSQTKAPRTSCGAYTITTATQFESQPQNQYVQFYNNRVRKILAKRALSAIPCSTIGMLFSMEDCLVNNHTVRYALPLDEIWWESASGKESSSTSETGNVSELKRKNSVSAKEALNQSSSLSENDLVLRYQAKLQVKQFIDSLEPYWNETRDQPGEDFNKPYREMTASFFLEDGLRHGECLEFGAWWGTKKSS